MHSPWRAAYVAIGSNLSRPLEQVLNGFERLAELSETRLYLRSRLYASRPMGPQNQPDFINAAAGLLTRLSPRALLEALLGIERQMGRDRQERWGPRIIDLDLIFMAGCEVHEAGLEVPHPGVSSRNFVLYPLSDIAPTLEIPGHGSVLALAQRVGREGLSVHKAA